MLPRDLPAHDGDVVGSATRLSRPKWYDFPLVGVVGRGTTLGTTGMSTRVDVGDLDRRPRPGDTGPADSCDDTAASSSACRRRNSMYMAGEYGALPTARDRNASWTATGGRFRAHSSRNRTWQGTRDDTQRRRRRLIYSGTTPGFDTLLRKTGARFVWSRLQPASAELARGVTYNAAASTHLQGMKLV